MSSLLLQGLSNIITRQYEGPNELGRKWADSILSWMNLVKAACKVPTDFSEIKLAFLKRVIDCVREHKIPPELILNWDQTGAKFVPTSKWTLEGGTTSGCSRKGR